MERMSAKERRTSGGGDNLQLPGKWYESERLRRWRWSITTSKGFWDVRDNGFVTQRTFRIVTINRLCSRTHDIVKSELFNTITVLRRADRRLAVKWAGPVHQRRLVRVSNWSGWQKMRWLDLPFTTTVSHQKMRLAGRVAMFVAAPR